MSPTENVSSKSSTTDAQGRADSSPKKLASLNHQDPETKGHHKNPTRKGIALVKKDPTTNVDNKGIINKENGRPAKHAISTQQPKEPGHSAGNDASVVKHHPSSNSPGIPQPAGTEPAATRRPLSEMTDFEREEARINARFERRLEIARQQLQIRDRELEELDRFISSMARRRIAATETARKAGHERKRARGAAEPVSRDMEAGVPAPIAAPVEASVKKEAPRQDASESSRDKKKKDILHLKSSSGNKVAKSGSSGWTAINHRR
ncbi:hypothetical protein BZA77DRAFT_388708 [Pyronema omphalodes]|nr:hypothetical protein BZA77DRAFT_388708 [Pyronema omphalodes]